MKCVVEAPVGIGPKIRGVSEDFGWAGDGAAAGLGGRLDLDDFHNFWF